MTGSLPASLVLYIPFNIDDVNKIMVYSAELSVAAAPSAVVSGSPSFGDSAVASAYIKGSRSIKLQPTSLIPDDVIAGTAISISAQVLDSCGRQVVSPEGLTGKVKRESKRKEGGGVKEDQNQ